ncbi:MAG: TetR/AcrR family transcriptional regulator C-terminal domain-containing protein [Myxococcaceae bacterium]|nr:TetR/AcrR family transcriptional regulator C-terminal domain-containing protein [Myxococcaceae bacterium]
MQGAAGGPNAMRHFEQCLKVLADTGLTAAAKLELLAHVDDYVFGHVLRAGEQHAMKSNATPEEVAAQRAFAEAQLSTGQFPHTRALFGRGEPGALLERLSSPEETERRFERGLASLLEGLAKRLGVRAGRRRARRRL